MESDSRAWQSLGDALAVLAEWHVLRGRPEWTVVGEPSDDAPGFVHAAWAELREISASDLLKGVWVPSASELVDRELGRFAPRVLTILRHRVFADSPMTLDDLGDRLGLTRERVRQIESSAVTQLRTASSLDAVRSLASHALGGERIAVPIASILGECPSLESDVVKVGQPLWRVLDRLDDSFEVVDGWWCRGSVKSAAAVTRSALLAAAAELRAIRVEDVAALKGATWATDWVAYCGLRVHEGHALLASSGIPDRAAVTLENEGAPMSGEDILARLGSERSLQSVKNALASDDRFVRVDRNAWALASWGLATYQSIRQLIVDEVASNGGSVRLSKLVTRLTESYSVSAASVMGYASAPPFTTADGIVEMSVVNRAAPRKSPFETKRLFRHLGGWGLRFVVTTEHARGSGSVLPGALIAVLGMEYGDVLMLTCRLGAQRVGWNGAQLALGSIKRLVDADSLAIGDTCFALFGDDGSFDVQRVAVPRALGPERAFALSGLSLISLEAGSDDLATGIGLPVGTPRSQIAEKLRARGDYDVADNMLVGSWS